MVSSTFPIEITNPEFALCHCVALKFRLFQKICALGWVGWHYLTMQEDCPQLILCLSVVLQRRMLEQPQCSGGVARGAVFILEQKLPQCAAGLRIAALRRLLHDLKGKLSQPSHGSHISSRR